LKCAYCIALSCVVGEKGPKDCPMETYGDVLEEAREFYARTRRTSEGKYYLNTVNSELSRC
jgi:hypothetical protein